MVSLILSPSFYIGCLMVLGIALRGRRMKVVCLVGATVLFLVFSNGAVYRWAAEQWYKEYDHPLAEGKTYTYGIVLGGYSFWDPDRKRVEFSEIADRLLEGIRLYKHKRIEKLVLASDGAIIESKDGKGLQGNPEGMMAFLKDMGMPPEDVILETKANSTWENATLTLELIGDSLRTEPSLLITSATHMRRSVLAFEKVGLHPDTYITDTFVRPKGKKISYMPSLHTLASWEELTHEWAGYLAYGFK